MPHRILSIVLSVTLLSLNVLIKPVEADNTPGPDVAVVRILIHRDFDSPEVHLQPGQSKQFYVIPFNAEGVALSSPVGSWESLSPDIVAIDDRGRAKAISPGAAVLVVRVGSYIESISVYVDAPDTGNGGQVEGAGPRILYEEAPKPTPKPTPQPPLEFPYDPDPGILQPEGPKVCGGSVTDGSVTDDRGEVSVKDCNAGEPLPPPEPIPVETALDVLSFAHSFYDLRNGVTWARLGFIVWDGIATVIPYVPGSWVAKVGRVGHAGLQAAGIVKPLDEFETLVNNKFIIDGVGLLGQGDDSVRKVLGIGEKAKAADFLGVTANGTYKIAEAKGSDLISAVLQLDNTATTLVSRVGNVEFTAEVVLRRGQTPESLGNFNVVGNHLHRFDPGVFNEKTGEWGGWLLQKANGKPITVRYE